MSESFMRQAMSDPTLPAKRGVKKTLNVLKFAVLAVSVAAAVPTAQNLYFSWKNDIPFKDVSHRLAQYDLWMKNLECNVTYRALSTAQGTRVDVGSCPKTGDIAIKVSGRDGQATYEWIAFENLQKPTGQAASLLDLIAAPAYAGAPAEDVPKAKEPADKPTSDSVAQSGMEVLCQAKVKTQIVRIVRDSGKCFREAVSPLKGALDSRVAVPCDAKCGPG